MEEQYRTDKQEASSLVPASSQNHHPRKLPNIPRNPEIYEPSPGIFKYILKDGKLTVPSSSSTSLKDSTRVSPVSSSTNFFDSLSTSKPSTLSYTDTESEEMLMELECYDEAAHNASMFPQTEPVEPLPNLVSSPTRLNRNPCTPGTNPRSSGTHPPGTGGSAPGPGYKRPNLDYQPPKLGDNVLHISTQPNSTTLPLSSEATEIDQCTPTDCDKFDTLKAKLNRAMQLYTLQRRQIVKLSGRVKNLSRTNERLTERSRLANTGSQGVNRPSPCLATDTKYIILFENLINPEAMNTITSAMSTADKPSD